MKKTFRLSTKYLLQLIVLALFSTNLISICGFGQSVIPSIPNQWFTPYIRTSSDKLIFVSTKNYWLTSITEKEQ
jgi:hypothetical protein